MYKMISALTGSTLGEHATKEECLEPVLRAYYKYAIPLSFQHNWVGGIHRFSLYIPESMTVIFEEIGSHDLLDDPFQEHLILGAYKALFSVRILDKTGCRCCLPYVIVEIKDVGARP